MTKIAVAGANGRMGRMIIEALLNSDNHELVAALCNSGSDAKGKDAGEFLGKHTGVLIDDNLQSLQVADCLIDFTRTEGTIKHLQACIEHQCNIVIGTTGFDEQGIAQIKSAAQNIGVVFSPNMSIGVNAMYALLKKAASIFDENYDIEIFESHHRHKVDAPSGTALKMGEVIAHEKGHQLDEIADWSRHGNTGERKPGQIGFSVLRGGDIIGEHTVSFCGPGERIELTHKASDRTIFAKGSIKAASFLQSSSPGFYTMSDVILA